MKKQINEKFPCQTDDNMIFFKKLDPKLEDYIDIRFFEIDHYLEVEIMFKILLKLNQINEERQ